MRIYNQLFTLLAVVLIAGTLSAQRTVIIEPGGIDVIKNTIEGEVASLGEEMVAQTTYVLRRGATYGYQTQFRPTYTVRIVAEDGDGDRPRILGVAAVAGESPRFARAEGPGTEFVYKSLFLPQLDNQGEHTDNAPIRPQGEGVKVLVEDCVIDFQRFEVIRTDAVDITVRFINNIISRNYQQDNWYKSGGLWFQRGNPVDTMIFHDNTYFNTPSIAFWQINGSDIDYLQMTNNTFVNVGGLLELGNYGQPANIAMIDMGSAINLLVENNLFYNIGFMGIENDFVDSMAVFNFIPSDTTESVVIRNNNIFTEDRFLENTPDSVSQIPLLTGTLDSFMNTFDDNMTGEEYFRSLNFSEELTFVDAPMNVDKFRQAKIDRWANPGTAANDLLILDQPDDFEDLDFFYGTSAQSFVGGTDGTPVGSSRWYGMFVGTENYQLNSSLLNLRANFPNPATSFTNFHFDLAAPATVSVNVYAMDGREVYRTSPRFFPSGKEQVLPAQSLMLVPGMYSYTVIANVNGKRVGATRRLLVQ